MTSDESIPAPRRRWWPRSRWLRRGAFLATGTVVGVLALRVAWGFVAERRLNALIASYRAEGGPVTVDDFNAELDRVPAEDNAAVLYERAFNTYVGVSKSGELLPIFMDEPESFTTKSDIADELIEANAAALATIREARDKPSAAWADPLGALSGGVSQLSSQRMLSRVLWFASSYHARHGNHYEAIETLRDLLRLSGAVDARPTVLSSLVAWACHDTACKLIEEHWSQLVVGKSRASEDVIPATREQMEQLIRYLWDEQHLREAAVRSNLGDRARGLNWIDTGDILTTIAPGAAVRLAGTPTRQVFDFMMHPVLVLDSVRAAEYDTLAAKAVSAETWPEAARFVPESPDLSATLLTCLTQPVTFNAVWGLNPGNIERRSAHMFFMLLARRRMAAIALAIRLYVVDHGSRPGELAELVPLYLPSLPRDPFARTDRSFYYKPDAERPLLYSVGGDGKDDEGELVRRANGRRDSERSDIAFYLEPNPVPASHGKADNDDQNVDHEQGNETKEKGAKPKPDKRQRAG